MCTTMRIRINSLSMTEVFGLRTYGLDTCLYTYGLCGYGPLSYGVPACGRTAGRRGCILVVAY